MLLVLGLHLGGPLFQLNSCFRAEENLPSDVHHAIS